MRWKIRPEKVGPRVGAARIVKRFAFVSRKTADGWNVWFESYWSEQKYGLDPAALWAGYHWTEIGCHTLDRYSPEIVAEANRELEEAAR